MQKSERAEGKNSALMLGFPPFAVLFFFLVILHTALYLFTESYGLRLYSIMLPSCALLMVFAYIEDKTPMITAIGTHLVLGAWGPIVCFVIPEKIVWAYGGHFLTFMCAVFFESNPYAFTGLLGINIGGWILDWIYYFHYRKDDPTIDPDIKWFFFNTQHLEQVLLAIGISYMVSFFIYKAKQEVKVIQANYESDLLKLNKELSQKADNSLAQSNKSLQDSLTERENFILRFSHEIRNPLNCLLGNVEICCESVTRPEEREMMRDAKISGEILLQLLNNVLDSAKISSKMLEMNTQSHSFRRFAEDLWVTFSEIIKKSNLYGSFSVNLNVPKYLIFDELRIRQIFMNIITNATKFTQKGSVSIFADFLDIREINRADLKPRYAGILLKESTQLIHEASYEDHSLQEDPQFKHEILTATTKKFRNVSGESIQFEEEKIDTRTQNNQRYNPNSLRLNPRPLVTLSDKLLTRNSEKSAPEDNKTNVSKDGYLRFEIIDSGCGIEEEVLRDVFKRFDQPKVHATSRRIGTGLGLWITKKLIEMMDGVIEIYSKPGIGTCLVFMIKTKTGNRRSSSDFDLDKQNQNDKRSQNTAKRVLVVEDIVYNQEINRRLLQKCQVEEITIAKNGLEGVQIYKAKGEQYFDAIFTDLDMPIMDGKTETGLIREHETKFKWQPAKIIVLTGYAESNTQQEMLDPNGPYRADFFLAKPGSLTTFMKILKSISKQSDSAKKVILVDCNSYDSSVLSQMLSQCGLKQISELNSSKIYEYYKKNQEEDSIIIIDCDSVQKPGLPVAKEIKKHRSQMGLKPVRIFGVTNNVGNTYRRRCVEDGLDGTLSKPLILNNMKDLLQLHGLIPSS